MDVSEVLERKQDSARCAAATAWICHPFVERVRAQFDEPKNQDGPKEIDIQSYIA